MTQGMFFSLFDRYQRLMKRAASIRTFDLGRRTPLALTIGFVHDVEISMAQVFPLVYRLCSGIFGLSSSLHRQVRACCFKQASRSDQGNSQSLSRSYYTSRFVQDHSSFLIMSRDFVHDVPIAAISTEYSSIFSQIV